MCRGFSDASARKLAESRLVGGINLPLRLGAVYEFMSSLARRVPGGLQAQGTRRRPMQALALGVGQLQRGPTLSTAQQQRCHQQNGQGSLQVEMRWYCIAEITHVEKLFLPKMRQS